MRYPKAKIGAVAKAKIRLQPKPKVRAEVLGAARLPAKAFLFTQDSTFNSSARVCSGVSTSLSASLLLSRFPIQPKRVLLAQRIQDPPFVATAPPEQAADNPRRKARKLI